MGDKKTSINERRHWENPNGIAAISKTLLSLSLVRDFPIKKSTRKTITADSSEYQVSTTEI